MLLADRGYGANSIRTLVRQHADWTKSNRAKCRETPRFGRYLCRRLAIYERFFNRIKQRQCMRFAVNYLAFIAYPACIKNALVANNVTIRFHRRGLFRIRTATPTKIGSHFGESHHS